ncbi:MAG: apolipoprotein N-acyltransferase [Alphaproteobacteria bacterium]|nr:apolipoprotein N-acyltransferase [Alphaproteobacteria bacterium]
MPNKMLNIKKISQYPKTLALVLGILATFALPPYYQICFLFISFGLFTVLLEKSENKLQAFLLGYCFGAGFFAIGFSWVANALALDIKSFGWLIPLALLGSGLFFGLFSGFAAFCSSFFKGLYAKIIALGAFWGISEWLRSFILTGFPWNLLGSIWTFDHTWLQTVSLFGTYGLSALSVIIFSLPAVFIVKPCKKNAVISLLTAMSILLCMEIFGLWNCQRHGEIKNSSLSIRVVQPSIPQSLKWDFAKLEANLYEYIAMSQEMGFEGKDVIIWGETASTFPLSIDHTHFEQTKLAVPPHGYLITGSVDYFSDSDDRWIPINAAHIIEQDKGIINSYIKSHLVPFGEYIPFRKFLPQQLRPITKVITDFKAGDGAKTFFVSNLPPLGLLICYEIIFPHQIIDQNNRPEWIINMTNDGWYGLSAGPYQHLATAQLRAAEEGITIVRAANSGISALISQTGKIIKSAPLHSKQNLDFYLPQNLSYKTIYSKYGNYTFFAFVFLLSLIALLASILHKSPNVDNT